MSAFNLQFFHKLYVYFPSSVRLLAGGKKNFDNLFKEFFFI